MSTNFMDEVYMSMPDHNQYLDDDHEKLDEALFEWVSKHHYQIRKTIEEARKLRNTVSDYNDAARYARSCLSAWSLINTLPASQKIIDEGVKKLDEAIKKHGGVEGETQQGITNEQHPAGNTDRARD